MDFQMFPSLPAADLGRAQQWYETTFGVKPNQDMSDENVLIYLDGDTGFMVYLSEFAGTNKATAAGVAVKDFDGAVAHLRSKGVTFEEFETEMMVFEDGIATGSDGRKAAWFKDSEGNILALSEDPR